MPKKKPKGWVKEPVRHGLASKGVKTAHLRPRHHIPASGAVLEPRDEAHEKVQYTYALAPDEAQAYRDVLGAEIIGFIRSQFARYAGPGLWPNEELSASFQKPFGEPKFTFWLHTTKWEDKYPLDTKSRLITYEPQSQLHILMKPADFLRKATGDYGPELGPEEFVRGKQTGFSQTSFAFLQHVMEKGEPQEPLFLDLDYDNKSKRWEVTGHGGRHRAVVAHVLDYERVPVILYVRTKVPGMKGSGKLTPLYELTHAQKTSLAKIRDGWQE